MAGVDEDPRAWEKKIPPDQVIDMRMTPLDKAFHERMLRHIKGISTLYEEWIKARNK